LRVCLCPPPVCWDLHYAAAQCNALQHTANYCDILQHTATQSWPLLCRYTHYAHWRIFAYEVFGPLQNDRQSRTTTHEPLASWLMDRWWLDSRCFTRCVCTCIYVEMIDSLTNPFSLLSVRE